MVKLNSWHTKPNFTCYNLSSVNSSLVYDLAQGVYGNMYIIFSNAFVSELGD